MDKFIQQFLILYDRPDIHWLLIRYAVSNSGSRVSSRNFVDTMKRQQASETLKDLYSKWTQTWKIKVKVKVKVNMLKAAIY